MSSSITPIDISNMPDLVRLVEDMKHTKKPRLLKQGGTPVAMLVPMATATERHQGQESTGAPLLRLAGIHGKGPADLSTSVDDYLYGEDS